MISETEAWLTYEAWKVICCSQYMVSHVKWAFGLPDDKLVMVPNGVNTKVFENAKEKDGLFRAKFALPEEKLVLFVGRLVFEKGAHVLINAIPKILDKINAKFVIVGSGFFFFAILIAFTMGDYLSRGWITAAVAH
jgi:glycogen(starch) synthase